MSRDLRDAILRSRATLLADALGVAALAVLLVGALSLPHLF